MTERVELNRDDAYWLLMMTYSIPTLYDHQRHRLAQIEGELNAQPQREGRPPGDPAAFDVYVVNVEYTEGPPIAMRTTPEAAFEIARAFNLAGGERTAEVVGYRFGDVGPGVALEIPE